MAFTNMPYVLKAGGGCGQDFVHPAPAENQDGVTIVLGHEIAETLTAGQVQYGAWFDYQGWEIGDKCAWVGDGLQVPGSPFNIVGNDGRTYPVQTLWSNQAPSGDGYCTQNWRWNGPAGRRRWAVHKHPALLLEPQLSVKNCAIFLNLS